MCVICKLYVCMPAWHARIVYASMHLSTYECMIMCVCVCMHVSCVCVSIRRVRACVRECLILVVLELDCVVLQCYLHLRLGFAMDASNYVCMSTSMPMCACT